MAYRDYINGGTVSVANGATTVTGVGTGFLAYAANRGLFNANGLSVPIVSIESNTSLTLAYGWPGTTLSGSGYSIHLMTAEAANAIYTSQQMRDLAARLDAGSYADIFTGIGYGASIAERDDFDARGEGFAFVDLSTNPIEISVRVGDTPGDWTDPQIFGQGEQGEQGDQGPQGDTGSTGPAGADGTDPGILFTFDTTTTDADPGSGDLRADNASLASATQLFVSKTSRGGSNIETFLLALDDSTNTTVKGTLVITDPATEAQATFNITGVTDASGYVKIAVSGHSGATSFANALPISFQFSRAGNKGADGLGTGDVVGPGSATGDALAIFDGTTGKLIKNSTVTILNVVTPTSANTLTNKTLTSPVLNTPQLNLANSPTPTPTATGRMEYGSGQKALYVGDGSGTLVFRRAAFEQIGPLVTISNVASVEFTNSLNLDQFVMLRLTAYIRPVTDNVAIYLQSSSNNGSSYDNGASDYGYQQIVGTVTSAVATAALLPGIPVATVSSVGNDTEEGVAFDLNLYNFNKARYLWAVSKFEGIINTGAAVAGVMSGRRLQATGRNAFRIIATSGNLSIGELTLEGVRG